MTQREFNASKLYIKENQIDLLQMNFSLFKIQEVLIDIYHSGSFYETYEYYKEPSTDLEKKLILRQIDHFARMDFIYDLKDTIQLKIEDLEVN